MKIRYFIPLLCALVIIGFLVWHLSDDKGGDEIPPQEITLTNPKERLPFLRSETSSVTRFPDLHKPEKYSNPKTKEKLENTWDYKEESPVETKSDRTEPLWKKITAFKAGDGFRPPVSGLSPPVSIHVIDPSLYQELLMEGGALLRIPANSLLNPDGSPARYPVKISYMSLNDPLSIFLAGINMQYDSAGVSSLFQTSGMFRLDGRNVENEELYIKTGARVSLDLPSSDTTDDYNYYQYDENSGSWDFLKPATVSLNESRSSGSWRSVGSRPHYPYDSIPYSAVFNHSDFTFLKHRNAENRSVPRWKGVEYLDIDKGAGTVRIEHEKSGFVRLYSRKEWVTTKGEKRRVHAVRLIIKPYMLQNFSDLKGYANLWFYLRNDGRTEEQIHLIRKRRWYSDVRVDADKESGQVTFYLKWGKGIDTLSVFLSPDVTRSSPVISLANRVRLRLAHNQYERGQEKKEKLYDNLMSKYFQGYLTTIAQGQMDFCYRRIQVEGFGTYNCDRIYLVADPVRVNFDFIDSSGKPVRAVIINVLDKAARANFMLTGNEQTVSRNHVACVFVEASGGKLYGISGREVRMILANAGNGQKVSFSLHLISDDPEEANRQIRSFYQ